MLNPLCFLMGINRKAYRKSYSTAATAEAVWWPKIVIKLHGAFFKDSIKM